MTAAFDDDPAILAARMEKVLDEQADAIRERLVTLRMAQVLHEDDTAAVYAFRDQLERYDADMLREMLAYVLWYGTPDVEDVVAGRLRRFNNATNLRGDPVAACLEEINRA